MSEDEPVDDEAPESPEQSGDDTGEQQALPEQARTEPGTEVSVGLRERRSTFFRVRSDSDSPVDGIAIEPGRRWTQSEADRQIRTFLIRMAGDRRLTHRSDPVELVRENDLMLLFGPEEEEAFARLALRFPDETVAVWATLLSGGDRSEAFGPRSRSERRDEAVIEQALRLGMRKRIASSLLLIALLVGGVLVGRPLLEQDPVDRVDRSLRFSTVDGPVDADFDEVGPVSGGLPVAAPALTAVADRPIAILRGEEPLAERIMVRVPDSALPVPRGVLTAAVFEHIGGQVALVGPDGWVESACIRVSVVTDRLRPLDTVLSEGPDAACPTGLSGRIASVTCLGSAGIVLAIQIPQGEVALIEGGSGWAEAVRFGIESPVSPSGQWETLAIRGTISVQVGTDSVAVPRFGGVVGDELTLDLGTGASGRRTATCTLV
jgi:hypothetical protein